MQSFFTLATGTDLAAAMQLAATYCCGGQLLQWSLFLSEI
jgi:hypothetical protein